MDFLFPYGWAILVILITIAGLAYFGVFDKTYTNKCTCNYMGLDYFSELRINSTDYYLDCINVTKYVDYENKKIDFNTTHILYYCYDNELIMVD